MGCVEMIDYESEIPQYYIKVSYYSPGRYEPKEHLFSRSAGRPWLAVEVALGDLDVSVRVACGILVDRILHPHPKC